MAKEIKHGGSELWHAQAKMTEKTLLDFNFNFKWDQVIIL
jgi:hypothetical protein